MRNRVVMCVLLAGLLIGALYLFKFQQGIDGAIDSTSAPLTKISTPKILIYNRIPKTASTTLMQLPYTLCKTLGYSVLMVNVSRSTHYLTLKDQITFVNNITSWSKRLPALYHGHFSYLNFERLGSPLSPLYINMIRRPIDRLVSYYYFLRYGDDYRVNKIRSRMGDKVTFDECVEKKLPDCDPKKLWIQVPWFCGHFRRCSEPGSRWALEQAKLNVARSYFLVGLTEDIEGFIDILEKSLPQFFKGAGTMYRSSGPKKYVRKTRHKDAVSEATIEALRNTKIWRIENEFYEFVASHYRAIKGDLESQANSQKLFHYQKVRP